MSCEMFFAWLTLATVIVIPAVVGWVVTSAVRAELRRCTRPG